MRCLLVCFSDRCSLLSLIQHTHMQGSQKGTATTIWLLDSSKDARLRFARQLRPLKRVFAQSRRKNERGGITAAFKPTSAALIRALSRNQDERLAKKIYKNICWRGAQPCHFLYRCCLSPLLISRVCGINAVSRVCLGGWGGGRRQNGGGRG